jgi:uncharacterized protein involved in exopolysaccharide biosynthesis
MNEAEKTSSLSLRDMLYVIFKWKKLIISILSIVIIAAAIYSFLSPPIYEASSKVFFKRERPEITLTPEKSDGVNRPITSKDVLAEIEIIKSRALLERVAKLNQFEKKKEEKNHTIMAYILLPLKMLKNIYQNIHSKREATDLEKNISKLAKNLKVEDIHQSDIIRISYQSQNAELAKTIINSITDQYIDYRLDLYGSSQAYQFFQKQLSVLKKNLSKSSKELRDYQEKNSNLISEEAREKLFGQLSEAETSSKKAEMEEMELTQKIIYLTKEIDKLKKERVRDPGKITNEALGSFKGQLVSLGLQRSDLLQKYTKEHPQVKSIEREIESLTELIVREERQATHTQMANENSARELYAQNLLDNKTQLASIKIRIESLEKQVNYYKRKIKDFENQYYSLKELEKKVKADEEVYNLYLEKVKESQVFLELDKMKVINARVLQYAEIPVDPIKPNKGKNMLMAVFLGLMVSFGSVVVLEYFNHGLKNKEEVEQCLHAKVLASIPFKNNE